MRHRLNALVLVAPVFAVAPLSIAAAVPKISSGQAADTVRADGYALVSKTEPAASGWAVWASKDGVAYEVLVDATTGRVVKSVAEDAND